MLDQACPTTESPGRKPGDTGSLGETVLPFGMDDGMLRNAESPGFRRGLLVERVAISVTMRHP